MPLKGIIGIIAMGALLLGTLSAGAEEARWIYVLKLRTGRSIPTERYWEEGEEIRFKERGGIVGIPKHLVASIEKVPVSEAPTSPAVPPMGKAPEIPMPAAAPRASWEGLLHRATQWVRDLLFGSVAPTAPRRPEKSQEALSGLPQEMAEVRAEIKEAHEKLAAQGLERESLSLKFVVFFLSVPAALLIIFILKFCWNLIFGARGR